MEFDITKEELQFLIDAKGAENVIPRLSQLPEYLCDEYWELYANCNKHLHNSHLYINWTEKSANQYLVKLLAEKGNNQNDIVNFLENIERFRNNIIKKHTKELIMKFAFIDIISDRAFTNYRSVSIKNILETCGMKLIEDNINHPFINEIKTYLGYISFCIPRYHSSVFYMIFPCHLDEINNKIKTICLEFVKSIKEWIVPDGYIIFYEPALCKLKFVRKHELESIEEEERLLIFSFDMQKQNLCFDEKKETFCFQTGNSKREILRGVNAVTEAKYLLKNDIKIR